MKAIKIAILASGSGTNAQNIYQYFEKSESINVSLILANKPDAYVLERAKSMKNLETWVFNQAQLKKGEVTKYLIEHKIDFIILAGFLLLIPAELISAYQNRIINIHPALLPKYGGKGMFGEHVHRAVVDNREKESGITIHLVNEKYDEGKVIFQRSVEVTLEDTHESLAKKIHALEYEHYPAIIENYIHSHQGMH